MRKEDLKTAWMAFCWIIAMPLGVSLSFAVVYATLTDSWLEKPAIVQRLGF